MKGLGWAIFAGGAALVAWWTFGKSSSNSASTPASDGTANPPPTAPGGWPVTDGTLASYPLAVQNGQRFRAIYNVQAVGDPTYGPAAQGFVFDAVFTDPSQLPAGWPAAIGAPMFVTSGPDVGSIAAGVLRWNKPNATLQAAPTGVLQLWPTTA